MAMETGDFTPPAELRHLADQLDMLASDCQDESKSVALIGVRRGISATSASIPDWAEVKRHYKGRVDGHVVVYLREWARRLRGVAERLDTAAMFNDTIGKPQQGPCHPDSYSAPHDWERIPLSDSASRCRRCGTVSAK